MQGSPGMRKMGAKQREGQCLYIMRLSNDLPTGTSAAAERLCSTVWHAEVPAYDIGVVPWSEWTVP